MGTIHGMKARHVVLPSTLLMAGAVVALAGCATSYVAPSSVRPATAEQVASCRYIDDFVGTSGWYGVFATKGIDAARQDVLDKAAAAGATHIVWQPPSVTYGSSAAIAKGFRCAPQATGARKTEETISGGKWTIDDLYQAETDRILDERAKRK